MTARTGGASAARLPLAAALVVGSAVVTTLALTPTPGHAAEGGAGTSASTSAVVSEVNQERKAAGCSPVTVDSRLTTAAQRHSRDQAAQEEMTHAGSDGSSVGERVTSAGYTWRRVGENVAFGTTSADEVMRMWMKSSSHRANILNCAFRHIGVAQVDGYWTQDFASPR